MELYYFSAKHHSRNDHLLRHSLNQCASLLKHILLEQIPWCTTNRWTLATRLSFIKYQTLQASVADINNKFKSLNVKMK